MGRNPRPLLGGVLAVTCVSWSLSFVAPSLRLSGPLRSQTVSRTSVALAAFPSSAEDAKAQLKSIITQENLAQEVLTTEGKPIKGRVDEAIVQLERFNQEQEPAYSEKLDGTWQVAYSGSYAPGVLSSPTRELALFLYGGGFSAGNALSSFAEGFWGKTLGVKLGEKTVNIQSGGRDVNSTAEIEIFGRKEKLSYAAEIMPLSPYRFSEEVISVELPGPLGKQDLPMELRRNILITYLDEDTLIVRDETGVPDVLVKVVPPAAHASDAIADAVAPADAEAAVLLDTMGSEAA